MIINSLIFGIIIGIVGIIVSKIITKGSHPKLDSPYFLTMLMGFILTGMGVYVISHVTGFTKSFCQINYD